MDHILIFGKDKHEHDTRLKQVLGTLSQSGLTINPEKFDFSKRQLDYMGQAEVTAVSATWTRRNHRACQTILGIVSQHDPFAHHRNPAYGFQVLLKNTA